MYPVSFKGIIPLIAHKDKRDPRGNSSKLFGCFKPVQAVFCKHDIHKYGVEKTGAKSL